MRIKWITAVSSILAAATFTAAPVFASDIPTPIVAPASDPAAVVLWPGDSFVSQDGRFKLTYQSDGNLVLYHGANALWASNTYTGGDHGGRYGYAAGNAQLQADGNLVVYNHYLDTPAAFTSVWASNTYNNPGDSLVIQPDGNAVIYNSSGRARWATNTCCH